MKVCAHCVTAMYGGECPDCGTYWREGTGYKIAWPAGPLDAVRELAGTAARLGLPSDAISLQPMPPSFPRPA